MRAVGGAAFSFWTSAKETPWAAPTVGARREARAITAARAPLAKRNGRAPRSAATGTMDRCPRVRGCARKGDSLMPTYVLPDLDYDYGALEPHISGQIMQLHHDKHHAAYVKKANETLDKLDEARD